MTVLVWLHSKKPFFQNRAPLIALFTVTFSHLHYNVFERGCEAISGRNYKISRNCLTSTFINIVMQMRKGNCEKGYCVKVKLHFFASAETLKTALCSQMHYTKYCKDLLSSSAVEQVINPPPPPQPPTLPASST